MIRICIGRDGRKAHSLVVTGHAGGPEGRDIVCAGVSALVATLDLYLHEGDVRCLAPVDVPTMRHEGEGAFFGCALTPAHPKAEVLTAVANGLRALAAEHPAEVQAVVVRCHPIVRKAPMAERVREFMARCRGALEASA